MTRETIGDDDFIALGLDPNDFKDRIREVAEERFGEWEDDIIGMYEDEDEDEDMEDGFEEEKQEYNPLIEAIKELNVERIVNLIEYGNDIHHNDDEALVTILNLNLDDSYDKGKILIITNILLENGADVNIRGGAPLFLTISSDNEDLTHLLLEYGAILSQELLMRSVTLNDYDATKTILDYGVKVNPEIMSKALSNNSRDIVKLLIRSTVDVSKKCTKKNFPNIIENAKMLGAYKEGDTPYKACKRIKLFYKIY